MFTWFHEMIKRRKSSLDSGTDKRKAHCRSEAAVSHNRASHDPRLLVLHYLEVFTVKILDFFNITHKKQMISDT